MEEEKKYKYRVRIHPRFLPSAKIHKVEVDEKETAKFIWINGKRFYKETGFLCFMDSFDDAKKLLHKKARIRLNDAMIVLQEAERCMERIVALEDKG